MNFQDILNAINAVPPNQAKVMEDGFSDVLDDGSLMRPASSGKPRVQRLYPKIQHTITLRVGGIHIDSLNTVYTSYQTNKNAVDELTHPMTGVAYTATWLRPPRVVDIKHDFLMMEFEFQCELA